MVISVVGDYEHHREGGVLRVRSRWDWYEDAGPPVRLRAARRDAAGLRDLLAFLERCLAFAPREELPWRWSLDADGLDLTLPAPLLRDVRRLLAAVDVASGAPAPLGRVLLHAELRDEAPPEDVEDPLIVRASLLDAGWQLVALGEAELGAGRTGVFEGPGLRLEASLAEGGDALLVRTWRDGVGPEETTWAIHPACRVRPAQRR